MQTKKNEKQTPLIFDLVDIAILPAALFIIAKVAGVFGLNYLLGLSVGMENTGFLLFPYQPAYERIEDVIMVESYSNLLVFITIISGTFLVASKSLLFNHKKASPFFVLKLAKFDLLHLLKSSIHIYKEAFIWGVFLIISTVYISISFLLGNTYGWVAGLSLFFCLTFLWIMLETIEEEILFHNYR
jgi:hypothetical protein